MDIIDFYNDNGTPNIIPIQFEEKIVAVGYVFPGDKGCGIIIRKPLMDAYESKKFIIKTECILEIHNKIISHFDTFDYKTICPKFINCLVNENEPGGFFDKTTILYKE